MEIIADVGPGRLLIIWLVVLLASVLRAFTGFGFALAAVPVFSLFIPPTESVVLIVLMTLTLSLLSLPTYRGVVAVRPLVPLLVMLLIGTALGAFLLPLISVAQFQLWAGLSVILAGVGLTFFQPSKRFDSPFPGWVAGLVAGLMNGALAIPGPPLIIYTMLVEREPRRGRAMLMTILLGCSLLALVAYVAAGFFQLQSVVYFLLSLPALYAGNTLGNRLFLRHGDALYRRIALLTLLAIGLVTSLRAVLSGFTA